MRSLEPADGDELGFSRILFGKSQAGANKKKAENASRGEQFASNRPCIRRYTMSGGLANPYFYQALPPTGSCPVIFTCQPKGLQAIVCSVAYLINVAREAARKNEDLRAILNRYLRGEPACFDTASVARSGGPFFCGILSSHALVNQMFWTSGHSIQLPRKIGAPDMTRTCDPLLRRQLLYPLSYGGRSASSIFGGLKRSLTLVRRRRLHPEQFFGPANGFLE